MRYPILDELRGLTVVSMILYHGMWDLVFLFHIRADWYISRAGYDWQQSICCTFIFLSGFCWSFGKKKIERGIRIFAGGAVITLATILFMPEAKVIFGVLTFLGSAALLFIPLHLMLRRLRPSAGAALSFLVFIFVRNINEGSLGIGGWKLFFLPRRLYCSLFTAFLGFPAPGFYSADYFPLLPWIFLYMAGYYCFRWMEERKALHYLEASILPVFAGPGRRSFLIYMLHQPVIYGGLLAAMKLME